MRFLSRRSFPHPLPSAGPWKLATAATLATLAWGTVAFADPAPAVTQGEHVRHGHLDPSVTVDPLDAAADEVPGEIVVDLEDDLGAAAVHDLEARYGLAPNSAYSPDHDRPRDRRCRPRERSSCPRGPSSRAWRRRGGAARSAARVVCPGRPALRRSVAPDARRRRDGLGTGLRTGRDGGHRRHRRRLLRQGPLLARE